MYISFVRSIRCVWCMVSGRRSLQYTGLYIIYTLICCRLALTSNRVQIADAWMQQGLIGWWHAALIDWLIACVCLIIIGLSSEVIISTTWLDHIDPHKSSTREHMHGYTHGYTHLPGFPINRCVVSTLVTGKGRNNTGPNAGQDIVWTQHRTVRLTVRQIMQISSITLRAYFHWYITTLNLRTLLVFHG